MNNKPHREYSIDLLRELSMLMIVSLHSLSHGNILSLSSDNLLYGVFFHIVFAICILSVNIFVLISGYFLSQQHFRTSKLINLICETLFYAWLILCLRFCLHDKPDSSEILASVLPISFKLYWFISAYIVMYMLSPVVNSALKRLTQKQHIVLIIVLVAIFSLWSDLIPFSTPMGISGRGTDVVWFVVLYIIGAYIGQYVKDVKTNKALIFGAGCCALLVVSWLALMLVMNLVGLKLDKDHFVFASNYYYRYNSLFSLIGSVCLFLVFKNIVITGKFWTRLIKFVAPLTLGVYLIHDNPLLRNYVWKGLVNMESLTPNSPLIVFVYVLLVFTICLMLDCVRKLVTSLYSNNQNYKAFMERLDSKTVLLFSNIVDKFL